MAKKRKVSRARRAQSQAKIQSAPPFGIIIVIFLIVGVVSSEMFGPTKGWISKSLKGDEVVKAEPEEEVNVEQKDVQITESPKAVTAEKAVKIVDAPKEVKKAPRVKSKEELRLEELYEQELAKLPKPVFGKRVQIQLKTGDKYFTHVAKVVGPRIYLEKMEPYNGSMNFPYTALTAKVVKHYFPKYIAKMKAMKLLEEEMAAKIKPLPELSSVASSSPTSGIISTFDKWSPQPVATPKFMALAVEEFDDWVAAQARRTGVNLADKVFGKRQGGALVLYVYASSKFVGNDYDTRLQLADGMRQFWGMRCMSNGLGKSSNAYVCIVDGRKKERVGGSVSTKSAEEVFVVD